MASSTNNLILELERELRIMKRKKEFKDIPDLRRSNGWRKLKAAVEREDIILLEDSFKTLEREIHCANHAQLVNSPDLFTEYTAKKNALLQVFRNSQSPPSVNICDSASSNVELQKKVETAEKGNTELLKILSEKRKSHEIDKIKTEMRRLESEYESCRDSQMVLHNKIETLERENTDLQRKSRSGRMSSHDIDRLEAEIKRLSAEKEHWKNSHMELQNKVETLERENIDLQRQSRSGRMSSHDIDRLEAEIKRLSAEKEHWKNRPSVMTENTLIKDNPTITDLSDPKRPSKLADKFSELYDNTWYDAYEVLCREMNEQVCIETLAEFLQGCYELCVGISNKQMEDVEMVLSTLTIDPRFKPCMKELPRGFVEARKECADKALAYVQKVVGNQVKERYVGPNVILKVPKYVKACTEVCWGMVIQEPKVCFLWPKLGKSTVVDMDLFSLYTRNGRGIEFVVWPAMLLHENGPLLRKGTVQPYEIPPKRR